MKKQVGILVPSVNTLMPYRSFGRQFLEEIKAKSTRNFGVEGILQRTNTAVFREYEKINNI